MEQGRCEIHQAEKEGDLVMERTIKSMEEKYLVPSLECLMVRELVPGGLNGIHGQLCYDEYQSLHSGG